MRFIVLVKATRDSEKGVMPSEKLLAEGWRIQYSKGGQGSFVDGPFAETKALVADYNAEIERFRKLEAERKN